MTIKYKKHIMPNNNNDLRDLLQLIDTVPPKHRQWDNDIIGYHITTIDNVNNIKQNGLIMHSSKQSYNRPDCVYLFLDNEIEPENIPNLLGEVNQYAIISVKIPKKEIGKFKFDGLYNISFDFGYGASMYFDNIPTNYITDIQIFNKD